ncbi:MAG: penicillin-binding protein activator LpoB [Pseudomonas sp.]|uniref:penicillin-binding protein activator LpoB n=1 Tax=Pseudomonas sp. TaxID=306 RepID=UPI0033964F45
MRTWIGIFGLAFALGAQAAPAPKVAVSDLAYEERVREYFHEVSANSQTQNSGYAGNSSASYKEEEGTYSYIERGELRKFTGDLKGEIIKSKLFQLIQGTPYTAKKNEGLYDVIARIKQGHFKGADFVLFGTVSDVDFRSDINDIGNTDSYSKVLGLTLVADFSLINTKTYAVTSAFTAMGEAQDVKLVNGNDVRVTPNRGRVIRDVSKALGLDVSRQLQEQLLGIDSQRLDDGGSPARSNLPPDEPAKILR